MTNSLRTKQPEFSVFQSSRDAENAHKLASKMNPDHRYEVADYPYGGHVVGVFTVDPSMFLGYLLVPQPKEGGE
jgi:hypothetical protein